MSLTSGRRELLFRESIHIILAPRRRGAAGCFHHMRPGSHFGRRRRDGGEQTTTTACPGSPPESTHRREPTKSCFPPSNWDEFEMDIFPSTTHLILVYIHLMYIVDRRLTYIWRVVFYLYYIQKEPISRLQALSVSSETTLVNNSRHYKTQSVVLTCPVKPKGAHVIFSSALTHLKNGAVSLQDFFPI
jgi:hypothetical protein